MALHLEGYQNQVWALVDAKSFYCSCEQIFDPKLANKPIVVLSNNDGCCVAISEQAKALGIKRGAPWFKIEREAQRLGVQVRSSNYTLYADMSRRFIEELSQFSPHVEQYSIDEAFVRLDGFQLDTLEDYGKKIRNTIMRNIGLPVRVGIGSTATLAYPRISAFGSSFSCLRASSLARISAAAPSAGAGELPAVTVPSGPERG